MIFVIVIISLLLFLLLPYKQTYFCDGSLAPKKPLLTTWLEGTDCYDTITRINATSKTTFNVTISNETTSYETWESFGNVTLNFDFNRPKSEIVPKGYVQIKIYETICGCNLYPCYEPYCYNQSKTIWIEENY